LHRQPLRRTMRMMSMGVGEHSRADRSLPRSNPCDRDVAAP